MMHGQAKAGSGGDQPGIERMWEGHVDVQWYWIPPHWVTVSSIQSGG